jgi:Xaa-Pro aminopeptidase/Xaa-Pro dipeptidase
VKARRKRLEKYCNSVNCDTLVTFEPENLFYLTGFWGEAVGILEKGGQTTIIAPELEAGRAKDESINCDVITSQRGGLISTLASLKKKKICVDCYNYSVMQSLKKSIPRLKRSSEPFYNARIIKDSDEVHILKKASSIIDQMFELCTQTIKKGRSESDLQAILMSFAIANDMHDTGYRSTLNPLIIAGGPNGALPHAQVTKRKFANGDMIVVDLTLRYKGYVSDATRTFGLGSISKEARTVYEIVKE